MGGSAGRADAGVGAVEAQKAEGVLHLHLFIYFQSAHQFGTLYEIGKKLEEGLLSSEAFKEYVNSVRIAAYPDIDKFNEERADIERSWPAYAKDFSLSRPAAFLAPRSLLCDGRSRDFERDLTWEEKEQRMFGVRP